MAVVTGRDGRAIVASGHGGGSGEAMRRDARVIIADGHDSDGRAKQRGWRHRTWPMTSP
uniref:Uncharacterized protein n=1 Tax=Oryza sativa subsp. japonica TaxID=39947 RepID=Q6ES19_ORYSJ|nr:hypothetical protein [Oryza sativa Japonica Group]